jgi:hypothetical protein
MLRLSWAKSLDYFLTNNVRARQWSLNSSLAARTRQAVHQPATRHPNVVRSAVGRIEHHDPPRAAWYLHQLSVSWGYDPSFYFAIDGFYVGAPALTRFVDAAHANGRGVTLDVVYNHSLGSSTHEHRPRRVSQRRL